MPFWPDRLPVYDVELGEIAGEPGSIIRVSPLEGGGRGGGDAFRILYRSTGLNGEPTAVSGAIFIPPGPAPELGRDVIAWAHPTSGVVEACAPSLMPDVAGMIWGLEDMLGQGHVVVATDYPGLGVAGQIHPYLIGVSEGRSVIDSVRAARDLPRSGASNRFVVWGHSQGGHAALYAGELAASYAPDLKLLGVATAAPATYLAELFEADISTPIGKEMTAMALYSWTKLYNKPASTLIESAAMAPFQELAHECVESVLELAALGRAEKPLEWTRFLKVDPTEIAYWREIMERNTPGQAPAGAPVFIAQGTVDTTVRPDVTKKFAAALCRQGERVRLISLNGVGHIFAAKHSVGQALAWMGARFRGLPAPSDSES
jgi:pimeloyl-ACP methyl ester carboxylesterase